MGKLSSSGELPEAFVILAAVEGSFASLRMTSVELGIFNGLFCALLRGHPACQELSYFFVEEFFVGGAAACSGGVSP